MNPDPLELAPCGECPAGLCDDCARCRWATTGETAPVQHALLLAAVIVLLPVAVVCLFVLERARDVLRAIVGRVPG